MAGFVNSQELEWFDATLKLLGVTLKGLRGFKYKNAVEKEHLYAAGSRPHGIQSGNEKPEGSIKVLKSEFDRLNEAAQAAGYANITKVPYQLIVGTFVYREAFNRPIKTTVARGISFTEYEKGMEQNAKFMEIELPFLALEIVEV